VFGRPKTHVTRVKLERAPGWCGCTVTSLLLRCCGFADYLPSVFQCSLLLLVRWDTAWGCCGWWSASWASSGRDLLQQACRFMEKHVLFLQEQIKDIIITVSVHVIWDAQEKITPRPGSISGMPRTARGASYDGQKGPLCCHVRKGTGAEAPRLPLSHFPGTFTGHPPYSVRKVRDLATSAHQCTPSCLLCVCCCLLLQYLI
jgi:hypothetical protein